MGRGPVPTEAQEHRALAQYLDLIEATTHGFFWTTIPLGGGGKARGGIIKGMGAKKGVPDILIIFNGRPTLIELKRQQGGQVRPEQRECHQRILLAGGVVCVAKGAGPAIDFVKANLLGRAA